MLVAGGLLLVRRELALRPRFGIAWRAAAAAAAMAGCSRRVPTDSLALLLPLGVVVYLGRAVSRSAGVDRRAHRGAAAMSASVLVLSAEPVEERMAGPAIRAAELARALAAAGTG